MDKVEILNQMKGIFIDIFDNDKVILKESTTANDVEEWDSLSHVQIIVAMEKHFNIRFTSGEIQGWTNVGEILNCIALKLGK